MRMPTLALPAGPAGAGKSYFINGVLLQQAEAFRVVNPVQDANEDWREGA
jgi:hypothetical protein